MKKKYALIIMFVMFFSIQNVYAANICGTSKYEELRKKASKADVKWELKYDKDHFHYYEVSMSDVDESLIVIYNNIVYTPKDGKLLISDFFDGGKTYEFKIYGGYDNPCVEEYLYTKRLKIPKYNIYSEMEECKGHEDIKICDKFYDGEIKDEEDFHNQLNNYLKGDSNTKTTKQTNNDNIVIICLIIVIIAVIAYVLYTKKINIKKANKGKRVKNEKK